MTDKRNRVGHLPFATFARAARKDNLAAMELLPTGTALTAIGRGFPLVVAQSPESAHQVLVADAASYRKPWIVRQVILDGLGENLFTLDGDRWLARRKPISPVFGLHNLDALAAVINDTVSEEAQGWESGEIDIQHAMNDVTVQVALRGLLGVDEETKELAHSVRQAFEEILKWISYRFNQPLSPPAVVPTPRNRRLKNSKGQLQDSIRALIVHRRERNVESVDILGQLLSAQTESRGELTDEAIVDECIGFMFAGHETTASTLTWALYELALRPDLQSSVALEGERFAASGSGAVEALQQMPTTESVMHETLRMYPAGISIVRSARDRTELAGRSIRRGTLVMIPVYAIQRSADTWDRPNEFDPSRDCDGREGYLPFGLGPRRCLGARFARTELLIALGQICSRWTLSYEGAQPPRLVTAPSLRAEGTLPLVIQPREM